MSTHESKKKSSSPKHSKREHQADKDSDDIPIEEVHTVNNWEQADLGDNQRKEKFLRLMGAKKRKEDIQTERQDSHGSNHSDEGSAEKKHCRSKAENESIERELEKQFNEGLQAKITHAHHEGLGFHGESTGLTSSAGDWHSQSTKTKFVPAKTDGGSSLDHVQIEKSDTKQQDKTSEKQDKNKKSKS
ncbi:unnamed protein product [Rotaria socialis]|uniref:Small acidic protein n=1 Tax=Rotaria socialis TaxID=392032 RepID=A0A818TEZ4_9BILA|nr:unnamed protein product [Rotaria socialis]CAF3686234.1 unnamed protein product [Rotaria socialis]CAF4453292.1 unnamed protein product [Rotaria socialis]CAF4506059.1 unnamed protein product [Rotaria socialis]